MNEKEYARLRKLAEKACDDKIAAAKQELRAIISGLDFALKSSPKNNGSASVGAPAPGGVTDAIKQFIRTMPEPFTLGMVVDAFKAAGMDLPNRLSVSSALGRMAEEGKIRLVEHGKGRSPAKYRRIQEEPEIEDMDIDL